MELPKPTELQALVSALAPGLIILGIRQRFVAAPAPPFQDRAIAYAAVSAVYYAIFNPIMALVQSRWGLTPWFASALQYVLLPTVFGAVYVIGTASDWGARWWSWVGFRPVHEIPTGWDYAFSRLQEGTFLLVTLADGSQVGGRYARGSFASSSSGERDLLVADVWNISEGEWTRPHIPRSILLCGRDIRSVEVLRQGNE